MTAARRPTAYLTVGDVTARLGLAKPGAVYAWIHSGALAAVNVAADPSGRPTWRVHPDALAEFLASRAAIPAPQAPKRTRRPKVKVTQYF